MHRRLPRKRSEVPPSHLENLILERRDAIKRYLEVLYLANGWEKAAIRFARGKSGSEHAARRAVRALFYTRDPYQVCRHVLRLVRIERELVVRHGYRPAEQFTMTLRYSPEQFKRVMTQVLEGERLSSVD